MKEFYEEHSPVIKLAIVGTLMFVTIVGVLCYTVGYGWHRVVGVLPDNNTVLFEASVVVYKDDGSSLTTTTIRTALSTMKVNVNDWVRVEDSEASESGYIVTEVLGGK